MKTEIEYYRKNVYGTDLNYVVDNAIGANLTILTGQVSLSERNMHVLEQLGFSFKEVVAPRS